MATKVIRYDSFKRGDTPVFAFSFTPPSADFNWNLVTLDAAITAAKTPTANTDAAVLRLDQSLTVDASNVATYELQPTRAESNALIPDTTYKVEVQLKDNAGTNVATAVTGDLTVEQDYII